LLATIVWCLFGWAVTARAAEQKASQVTPQQAEFFEARIRPVFVENCVKCHGPKKQKGGLRLDAREEFLEGGENGPVIKPGDPAGSLLIQAIRHEGETKMPPKKKLKARDIDALTAWVKMGAPWPVTPSGGPTTVADKEWKKHWAFQPVKNPSPPQVKDNNWPLTSIDRFILAKLETRGLSPSSAADRRTLLRRATLDLLGLPPTPSEIAAFEADPSPNAFAKVVDRLLASPHYGERWGRYWLDVARYADTKGYVFFQEADFPWAYTYRDYVIRSFNEDLPYNRFVLEQLAADHLLAQDKNAGPNEDRRALTALGFLTLGGRFMNNQYDILDDRIDVVTRGLLGLTVTCARCHDHKFDPIPSKDYYSLYGVFASSEEPEVPPLFTPPPKTKVYEDFDRELRKREEKLTKFVKAKHAELVKAAKTRAAEYLLAAHAARNQPNTEEFMLLADGNDLNPRMLVRWRAYLERTRKKHHPVLAPWHAFAALPDKDFAARAKTLTAEMFGKRDPARSINPLVVKAFANKPPQTIKEVAQRYCALWNAADKLWQEGIQHATQKKLVLRVLPDPAQEELRQCFYGPDSAPNVAMNPVGDLDLLPDRPSQATLQELRKAVETWRATGRGAPPRAMVLHDTPVPYAPRVFLRGNPNNLGEPVPRQFLGVLAGEKRRPFAHGSGRLDLAEAVVDPRNPLTARVLVNRLWLHHFGTALVRTPGDFGMRSDPPSHPELLDHLASTFMGNGWSIKAIQRLIMLSAVYQQKSDDREACRRTDPENLLLWKMNRRRLDFEATRDALLAVSGRLHRIIGGPSVRDSLSAAANRRTLYSFLDRLNVPELFRTFDFPSPDATSPKRDNTTVAPQALFLMNNPFVLECARRLMQRPEIAAEKDLAKRVGRVYRLLYCREPSGEEIALGREFLVAGKDTAAAWERYAQALLLANEFVFID
jgi:mono/diheme cytochrome c family protein